MKHTPRYVRTQRPTPTTVTRPYQKTVFDPSDWQLYDSVGHDGAGVRSPSAVRVTPGGIHIIGTPSGLTGGTQLLGYPFYQGTVNVVATCPPGAGRYHPVVLLWGQGSGSSVDAATGELDLMEFWDNPLRDYNEFTLHYGDGSQMMGNGTKVSPAYANVYSVYWTDYVISAKVNGIEYFRSTDTAKFPKVPMDLCIQLDWFPYEETTPGSASMTVSAVEILPL